LLTIICYQIYSYGFSFDENKTAARKGGKISGDARKKLEEEIGDKVVSPENYLTELENQKRLKK